MAIVMVPMVTLNIKLNSIDRKPEKSKDLNVPPERLENPTEHSLKVLLSWKMALTVLTRKGRWDPRGRAFQRSTDLSRSRCAESNGLAPTADMTLD